MIIALKAVYAIVCLLLIVIILLQQSKVTGLSGTISGAGDTYWGKNKARSMEGGLHKATVALAFLFIGLSLLINFMQ